MTQQDISSRAAAFSNTVLSVGMSHDNIQEAKTVKSAAIIYSATAKGLAQQFHPSQPSYTN